MKRIATIQDISCLGKCSLTVALPILSAMGMETAILPTAVFSTHTLFSRFTRTDLTEALPGIIEHWKEEKFAFDAIYSGYLGTPRLIGITADLFRRFRNDHSLMVVDPVMADNGKLYPGFTEDYARQMTELCAVADVIVPNMTEASLMLGVPYRESGYDEAYIRLLLRKLTDLGARTAVLTGVSFEEGRIGAMAYCAEDDTFTAYFNDRVDAMYHGTGDIFASTLVGSLVRGDGMEKALQLAADYTRESIRLTKEDPNGVSYGVNFEQVMGMLTR